MTEKNVVNVSPELWDKIYGSLCTGFAVSAALDEVDKMECLARELRKRLETLGAQTHCDYTLCINGGNWTSVEDMRPTGRVLGCFRNNGEADYFVGEMPIRNRINGSFYFYTKEGWRKVTHWMPLPDSPHDASPDDAGGDWH